MLATQEESCIVNLKQSQNLKVYDEPLSILQRMPSSGLHGSFENSRMFGCLTDVCSGSAQDTQQRMKLVQHKKGAAL